MVDLLEISRAMRERMTATISGKTVAATAKAEVQAKQIKQTATLNDKIRLFVQLSKWKGEIDDLLEFCKEQIAAIEPEILEGMAGDGVANVKIDGMTVFTKRDRYVSKSKEKTSAQMIEILRESGMGYLCDEGYSAQGLKSRILELIDAQQEKIDKLNRDLELGAMDETTHATKLAEVQETAGIPAPLLEALNIGEVVRLAARKA